MGSTVDEPCQSGCDVVDKPHFGINFDDVVSFMLCISKEVFRWFDDDL